MCITSLIYYTFKALKRPKEYIWHQRISLEFATPNGTVLASNIYKVHIKHDDSFNTGPKKLTKNWYGEAIIIDLPKNTNNELVKLFMLVGNQVDIVQNALKKQVAMSSDKKVTNIGQFYSILQNLPMEANVLPKHYPTFVTFENLENPLSVRILDTKMLDQQFSTGVSLNKITVQICNETVTKNKVRAILDWLPENIYLRLDGRLQKDQTTENPTANALAVLDFERHEQ